jgi:hypothetical protein
MFGGIAFMLRGHMFMGVIGSDAMARVGVAGYDAALARPGVRVMDFTGRPMTGFVHVSNDAIASNEALQSWVDETCDFASALPPKTATGRPSRRKRA